jgi:D-alanyl-D-alanine dipeptidase
LKLKRSDLTDREIDIEVRNKIAMPDDLVPPGHMTGGAVDVVLGDDNGNFIPTRIIGTDFINDPNHQYTFCKNLPKEMYRNRMILYKVMIKAGFSNFFREYWHYSYGDGY